MNVNVVEVKSRTKTRSMPYYCAYDSLLERLYVTDYDNDQVLVYCAVSFQYILRFGKRGSKTFGFNKPTGITYSPANKSIVVVDCWNHRLHVIQTPLTRRPSPSSRDSSKRSRRESMVGVRDYTHTRFVGDDYTDSTYPYYLAYPGGVCVDDDTSRIYVTDRNGEKIVVFSFEGEPVGIITSNIRMPTGISFDSLSKRLYVCDQTSKSIKVFTKDGRYVNSVGVEDASTVGHPYGVVVVGVGGARCIVASEMNESRLRVCFCSDGSRPSSSSEPGSEIVDTVRLIGSEGVGQMEFVYPRGLCALPGGRVCIVDSENARLQIITITPMSRGVVPPLIIPPPQLNSPVHSSGLMSPHIARLVSLHQSFASGSTPRSQSPRVTNDRLISSVRRARDLRHLYDVSVFISSLHTSSIISVLDYLNMDSFLSTMPDTSQAYVDASIEKKKRMITSVINKWQWDSFTKEDVGHIIRFVITVQYSSDMEWLVKDLVPRIEKLCHKFSPKNLVKSTESALGFNTTTKAVYRTGHLISSPYQLSLDSSTSTPSGRMVFIKTITLENEIWWHRELRHNTLNIEGIVKMEDYYFEFVSEESKWTLSMVFEYVPLNYADVLSMWTRMNTLDRTCVPTIKTRVGVCVKLARTISTLHTQHHLIHRDIKLHNILCDSSDFDPVVCDLGLSETEDLFHTRSICEGPYDDLAPELTHINSSRALETSRDRVRRVVTNPYAVDIYNLGGVIYLLLTLTHHSNLRDISGYVSLYHDESKYTVFNKMIRSLIMECRNPRPEDRIDILTVVKRLETLHSYLT